MHYRKLAAGSVLCVVLMSVTGHGQSPAPPDGPEQQPEAAGPMPGSFFNPPALTKLEAFGAQRGMLVIKGFTEVGQLNGDDGSGIRVMAVEFTDGARKNRERGLVVHVVQNMTNPGAEETISYIDEDEIDALIETVGVLGKLRADASPMEAFEGRYQTRGDLELANVNLNGGRMIRVRGAQFIPTTGQPQFATATFFPPRMQEFQQRLDAGRNVLARLRENRQ